MDIRDSRMHGRAFWPLRIAGFVLLGVIGAGLFALAFGWFVQLLWNWLMPAVFGLGTISYWQAFGIVVLAKLVFGGLGPAAGRRGGWGPHGRRHWEKDWGHDRWRFWREFWEEEGRASFERFVEKKAGGKQPEPSAKA